MSATAERATLREGYTMADVDRLARVAVNRVRAYASDAEDRYEAAWFGIVEALYSGTVLEHELLFAGMNAVRRLANEHTQAHGIDQRNYGEHHRAFWRYWEPGHSATFPEDAVCERLALPQLLALLTGEQYDALIAVAASPTLHVAALSLGLTDSELQRDFYAARKVIREAWHAPQSAPTGRKATATKCSAGHDKSTNWRVRPSGKGYCVACHNRWQRANKAKKRLRAVPDST